VELQGIEAYSDGIVRGSLSDAFWEAALPQQMNTDLPPLFGPFILRVRSTPAA
jgi:hypothetical protein